MDGLWHVHNANVDDMWSTNRRGGGGDSGSGGDEGRLSDWSIDLWDPPDTIYIASRFEYGGKESQIVTLSNNEYLRVHLK